MKNKKEILKKWDKLFQLNDNDRIYYKVSEDHKGDDWLVAFGKDAETNKEYYITTNSVHASELMDISDGAKADAEFFVNVLNLKHNGKFREMEQFLKEALA